MKCVLTHSLSLSFYVCVCVCFSRWRSLLRTFWNLLDMRCFFFGFCSMLHMFFACSVLRTRSVFVFFYCHKFFVGHIFSHSVFVVMLGRRIRFYVHQTTFYTMMQRDENVCVHVFFPTFERTAREKKKRCWFGSEMLDFCSMQNHKQITFNNRKTYTYIRNTNRNTSFASKMK